jgi:hypothetical protein
MGRGVLGVHDQLSEFPVNLATITVIKAKKVHRHEAFRTM